MRPDNHFLSLDLIVVLKSGGWDKNITEMCTKFV